MPDYTPCTQTNTPRTHKIGVSAAHAYLADGAPVPVSVAEFAILQNNHQWNPTFVDDPGNNGTPHRQSEGVVGDKNAGTGSLSLIPRADDLRTLLPLIIGGAWAVNVLEPDFICNFFTLEAFKGVSNHHHVNAKTSQATFSSSSTQPNLQLEWGIESCHHSRDTTFTAALTRSAFQPFNHTKATLLLDSNPFDIDNIQLVINNNLTLDEYFNHTERTDLPMNEQAITLAHSSPYKSALDIALQDYGATSIAAQLEYVSAAGDLKLTIDLPALHAPVSTPVTPSGNTSVRNEITWTARTIGSGASVTRPIKFTLDDVV